MADAGPFAGVESARTHVTPATPAWVQELVAGWEPRERLGGAAWAERERVLSAEESPATGPWRNVPWQVEILDALADPSLQTIVILKATQVGVSELVRCAIGRWALLDPGDVLWVMTTQHAAERAMKKLQAMFRSTPALRPLLSPRKRDTKLLELVLVTGMRIVIGWAGSAQSLSSDPFRYVVLDEAAKYVWNVQGEGSPVDLARDRTKVFGRRGKVVLLSSPKEDGDPIVTAYGETPDRRVFGAPCPSCGAVQPFEWDRVRWPGGGEPERAPTDPVNRVAQAELVEREQSAWLACVTGGCEGKIEPGRAQWQPGARWSQEEPSPPSRRRAYHVPEAWHWETTLSDLVGKFLRATHPRSLQTFHTGTLGLPYRVASTAISASVFEARALHPRIVPSWATVILSTADTQLGGWWFMTRAWGRGGRSRLLDWGFVTTEEELVARGLRAVFPVEGGGPEASPWKLAIDTGGGMKQATAEDADGSRTKQVYALVRKTRGMVALKGEGDKAADAAGAPHRLSKVEDLDVHLVRKDYYADELARLVRATPVLWEESVGVDATYTRQMTSEHRVLETTEKGSKWLWKKKTSGAANHLWDCARYQVWLADHVHVETRTTPTWRRELVRGAPPRSTGGDLWERGDAWSRD